MFALGGGSSMKKSEDVYTFPTLITTKKKSVYWVVSTCAAFDSHQTELLRKLRTRSTLPRYTRHTSGTRTTCGSPGFRRRDDFMSVHSVAIKQECPLSAATCTEKAIFGIFFGPRLKRQLYVKNCIIRTTALVCRTNIPWLSF